jgi:hypothetical protein
MSLLLQLENPCQGARFTILVRAYVSMVSMPPRQNASHFGFLRLITNPHELSGLASMLFG